MLLTYQAEWCKNIMTKPELAVWEEITVITDIFLCMQWCAVQTTGKSMGMMVLQE